jgi:hypothetical protein
VLGCDEEAEGSEEFYPEPLEVGKPLIRMLSRYSAGYRNALTFYLFARVVWVFDLACYYYKLYYHNKVPL